MQKRAKKPRKLENTNKPEKLVSKMGTDITLPLASGLSIILNPDELPVGFTAYRSDLEEEYDNVILMKSQVHVLKKLNAQYIGQENYEHLDDIYLKPSFKMKNGFVTSLYLRKCHLKTVPEEIGTLTALRQLDLRDNQLDILPESFNNLKNLEELGLSRNHFKVFPDCILYMRSLKVLMLTSNKLDLIPESIGQLSNLESIEFRNNKLGSVPRIISDLPNLKYFDLRDNP